VIAAHDGVHQLEEVDTTVGKESITVVGEPVRVTRNGRRYFSKADKDAVVAQCLVPGVSLAAVALDNGFNANLVRRWVRRGLAGAGKVSGDAKLLPVTITDSDTNAPLDPSSNKLQPCPASPRGTIEIEFAGARVLVKGAVDMAALRVVLDALSAR
jgi:transposase